MPIGLNTGETYQDETEFTLATVKPAPIKIPEEQLPNDFDPGIVVPRDLMRPENMPDEMSAQQKTDRGNGNIIPPITHSAGEMSRSVIDRLTGADGEERYQLWPERLAREGLDSLRKATETFKLILDGKVAPNSDAGIKAVTDMALTLGVGGLATAPMKPGVGVFGGMSRLVEDLPLAASEALQNALRLDLRGNTQQEIWEKTGWYKDLRDQQWKFEIPDKGAKVKEIPSEGGWKMTQEVEVNPDTMETKMYPVHYFEGGTTLGKILDHPLLFKIYPELEDIHVAVDPKIPHRAAAFPEINLITLNPEIAKRAAEGDLYGKSVLLHEIQHLIQGIEKFGGGGSPEAFKKLSKEEAMEAYLKLPGEIEARNVQYRFAREELGKGARKENPSMTEDQ